MSDSRTVPLGLYHTLKKHKISSGVLARLLETDRRVIEHFVRRDPRSGLRPQRREIVRRFLLSIGVPEHEVVRAFDLSNKPRLKNGNSHPGHERLQFLNKQVVLFKKRNPDLFDPDKWETAIQSELSLLEMEAPMLTRQSLPFKACEFFGFINAEGNLVDPFFPELKDPDHGQHEWPGYNETFQEVLALAKKRAMFALVGPPASGKSFLLARALRELRYRKFFIAEPDLLTKAKVSEGTILNATLKAIAGDGVQPKHALDRRCEQIHAILSERKGFDNVLLVVDEAQELPAIALKCMKRLYDWSYGAFDNLLSILMVGHSQLANILRGDLNVQETGRRTVILELPPLDSITGYLDWRLNKVLGKSFDGNSLFTEDGLEAFGHILGDMNQPHHDWRPLLVNNLISACLNQAYLKAEKQISVGVIRELGNAGQEKFA